MIVIIILFFQNRQSVIFACLQIYIQIAQKDYTCILIMNIETNSYENGSPKCKGCKIYFGAEAFQGLCSGCYKKHQGQTKETMEKVKTQKIQQPVSQSIVKEKTQQVKIQMKDKNKCQICSRKLRNLGIECKCGFTFCTLHRLPEDHKCTFDHMANGIKKLQKDLIKVANGKVESIE